MSSEAAPELKIVGYCRACGKPLDESSVHSAQGTIYCAEHAPAGPPPLDLRQIPATAAAGNVPPQFAYSPYSSSLPPPVPDSGASPGFAFVLGMIPGVGAIYNGQYAKGLIHVFILGLLFTIVGDDLAGGMEPMVGLLTAAFWAYMPFEAYHTAQKRRLGQPVEEFSGLTAGVGRGRIPVAPIVLIAMGVIFLLNNLGWLEIRRVIRYWPVLMIAAGVYLLWTRMAGAQKSGSSAGGSPPSISPAPGSPNGGEQA